MAMPVALTIHDDETLVGFASRVAAANGYRTVEEFLMCIGTNRRQLGWADPDGIEALAYWTGANVAQLSNFAIPKKLQTGRWQLGGAYLDEETGTGKSVRYCPCCIVDDWDRKGSRMIARPYERAIWLTRLVPACPLHTTSIIEADNAGLLSDFSRFMETREKLIRRQAADAGHAELTPLAQYVAGRVMSADTNKFLDGLPCFIVVTLSRHLGEAMKSHPERAEAFDCDESLAPQEMGFQLASQGPDAIRGYFHKIATFNSRYRTQPGVLFGKCLMWLRRYLGSDDHKTVADLFHQIGSHCLVVGEGEPVIYPLEKRILYSATLAARAYGIVQDRVVRLVTDAGLAISTGQYSGDCIFYVDQADKLLRDAALTLRISDITRRLGVGHTTVQRLIDGGLLVPQEDRTSGKRRIPRFSPEEVSRFQERLFNGAQVGDAEGFITLGKAARRMSCSFEHLVNVIYEGKVNRLAKADESMTLNSLLVDWEEIKVHRITKFETLALATDGELMTFAQVTQKTGINQGMLARLVRAKLIAVSKLKTAAHGTRRGFKANTIERFMRDYASLQTLANMHSLTTRLMRKALTEQGINPVRYSQDPSGCFYFRKDVAV